MLIRGVEQIHVGASDVISLFDFDLSAKIGGDALSVFGRLIVAENDFEFDEDRRR